MSLMVPKKVLDCIAWRFDIDSVPMQKRTCRRCDEKKPMTDFAKDTKGKLGYAVSCKACKNAAKHKPMAIVKIECNHPKKKHYAFSGTYVPPIKEKKMIPVTSSDNDFAILSKNHNSHFNISVSRSGKVVLSIQSNPSIVYKGTDFNVLGLIEEALAGRST